MKRTAFATTSALLLMAVVSAALLVLGALLRADANRTLSEAEDAQLRQLLYAGALDATVKSNSGVELAKSWDVALPPEIGGSVHVEVAGRRATITARQADRQTSETIRIENRR
ncbi:MAG: hypothetical protein H7Z14_22010 [Anaerolineae bacterium]|nr:hypothetical protein [Phycisphaerae bacterium]